MRNCAIIANRGAGSFSRQSFDSLCLKIESAGTAVLRCFCSDFAEMTDKAAELSGSADSPIIVAAGGDGTINAVFNGLAGKSATCAILPMGTANVMAIELKIDSSEDAVARITSGNPHPFTSGLINSSSRSSRFFLMAGAGFDGQVVKGVSLKEKKLLGKGAYVLSALRSFAAWDFSELQITTGDEEFSCNSLIICNSSRYGGSFSLAPSASIFSPGFELVAVRARSRRGFLQALAGALPVNGRSTALYRTTASRVTVRGIKPVQADGDYWGDSPVEIAAEPGYAEIMI